MASVIAAFAASGAVVMTGGAALPAIAAAVGAGGGVGAIGALICKRAGHKQHKYLDEQLPLGGLLLGAKMADPANEPRIRPILMRHAARDVLARDITGS